MSIFRGGYQSDISTGMLNLCSIKQMLFCIAQDDSAAQEMNYTTLLGISNILEDAGHEIEHDYNALCKKEKAAVKRHMKLRAFLGRLS
ncbi:hypothetical protein [uncultured Desulfobacter sp.]|uniref:hypothetical protein n=1 Tax=uncultured Desulfobacter sp. TaxID=240139 RepID=UPI002AABEE6D|nr:hypothetical protein [uncultured Desulfobacter sp.]